MERLYYCYNRFVKKAVYIVAVSGGVDSVVLLHALANGNLAEVTSNPQLIIAHFDHGMREDSSADEAFVRGVAQQYSLAYETERVELGANANEARARQARYDFLRRCSEKYQAQGVITAHHQDDLIETMVINLLRGTGWRGLVPMEQSTILRPLLGVAKAELLNYAKKYRLEWRDDSTNTDESYVRNYVRLQLLPAMQAKDPHARKKFLKIYHDIYQLKQEIAMELQKITTNHQIPRHQLVMWPPEVAREVIYTRLVELDTDWHPTKQHVSRVLHFAKTGRISKELILSGRLTVISQKHSLLFQKHG